jgi:hypothetical protein
MKLWFLNIIFCVLIIQTSIAQNSQVPNSDNTNVSFKQIVDAHYKYGKAAFYQQIKELVTDLVIGTDFKLYHSDIEFTGEVSEKGEILLSNYKSDMNPGMAVSLEKRLMKLPNLEPALVNGNPVAQKIEFKFRFLSGFYRFGYRLVPLQ